MATGLLIAAGALQAFSSIKQGIDARKQAKKEAMLIEAQAEQQAREKQKALKGLMAQQRLGFAKSGVTLEGSPLLIMEETQQEGQQEISDILSNARMRANMKRSAGRDAFTAGLINAGASAAKTGYQGSQAGLF